MAKARPIPGVDADVRFRDAAASAVEVRTEELFSFADRALDTNDIERVHDMRVASRRLRAALEVFARCFPKREFEQVLDEVKALADDLGERRDPDVAIEELERVAAGLRAPDRPGVSGLIAELRDHQAHGNRVLAARLERIEADDLHSRLLALATLARSTS